MLEEAARRDAERRAQILGRPVEPMTSTTESKPMPMNGQHIAAETTETAKPAETAELVDLASRRGGGTLPPHSDEALALRFADENADKLRYVHEWGRWFRWTGQHWRQDKTLVAFDAARALCREAAKRAKSKAEKIASAKTVYAVVQLARADRRIAATADQWDADPWLLNTPGGTVELRTGKLRPHRRDDHITQMTAAAPRGECPMWLNFLNDIFGRDLELVSFLQRWAGYCLTGVTIEQKLVFGHGTGNNGKGVTISTLAGIVGDYALTSPMETFIASHSDKHPTDLAMLRGARLVTATVTEKGRTWAESKIKTLTGGDKVAARFMRQDFFEFVPQFKLMITGNHKPALTGVDEAIRRRPAPALPRDRARGQA
jgi:putative DNA primase/helicase